jgi:citrate synthase
MAQPADYHLFMTNAANSTSAVESLQGSRPYSPGLEGVIAGETSLAFVDGERGRLTYRGYRIGDLVAHGTYPAVANLLWTGTRTTGCPPHRSRRPS